jgi:hypothetical protein
MEKVYRKVRKYTNEPHHRVVLCDVKPSRVQLWKEVLKYVNIQMGKGISYVLLTVFGKMRLWNHKKVMNRINHIPQEDGK